MGRRAMTTSSAGKTEASQGFSMLEVMIVIAILSVAATFVLPNLSGMLWRENERALVRQLRTAVLEWRIDALASMQTIEIDTAEDVASRGTAMADTLRARVLEPLTIYVDGTCSRGVLRIEGDSGPWDCRVADTACEVSCERSDGR